MEFSEIIFAFIFGVAFGSFGNVLIYRVPQGLSIIKPSSFCPECKSKIKFYHNIPLFSYIFLQAKCSSCGAKIPFHYFLIELFSGILAVMIVLKAGFNLYSIAIFFAFFFFLVLSIIDLQYKAVPDSINFVALFFAIISGNITLNLENTFMAAGLLVLLKYLIEFVLKKEALGEADVILFASISALLAFKGALVSIFFAALFALPFGFFLKEKEIPFIPFLAIGALIVFFFKTTIFEILDYA